MGDFFTDEELERLKLLVGEPWAAAVVELAEDREDAAAQILKLTGAKFSSMGANWVLLGELVPWVLRVCRLKPAAPGRFAALELLTRIYKQAASEAKRVAQLERQLSIDCGEVLESLAQMLTQTGDLPLWMGLFQSPNPSDRCLAACALSRIDDVPDETLLDALEREKDELAMAGLLLWAGPKEIALERIRESCESGSDWMRPVAALAWLKSGTADTKDEWRRLLESLPRLHRDPSSWVLPGWGCLADDGWIVFLRQRSESEDEE